MGMASPFYRKLSAMLCLVLALGAAGCARKRTVRVPAPPPNQEQIPHQESAPPVEREDASSQPRTLRPPDGCKPFQKQPWLECVHQSSSGDTLKYFLYLPTYTITLPTLPVLTFLHGSSGSGPGDGKALEGGHRFGTELWLREDIQTRYPHIVMVPQFEPPPGETWVRAWRASAMEDARPKEGLVLVVEAIELLAQVLPVDANRLYLTGQSMGGFGAWLAYTRYPGKFAAVVPVCGGGDPGAVKLNPTAVWAFHGDRDTVVPADRSREMVRVIQRVGGQVRYTEYPGAGHNIFERAYQEPGLVEWLFRQSLQDAKQ